MNGDTLKLLAAEYIPAGATDPDSYNDE